MLWIPSHIFKKEKEGSTLELHNIRSSTLASQFCFGACEVCFFHRSSDLFTQAVDHLSACSSVREDRRFCSSSWKSAEAQASLLFWTQRSLHEAWETDPVPHTKETLIQGWVKQMLCLYIIKIYWLFFWSLASRELPWKKKRGKKNWIIFYAN